MKRLLILLLHGLLAAAALASLASFLGRLTWLFDLLTSFRVQYFLLLSLLGLALSALGQRLSALVSFAFATLNLIPVLPFLWAMAPLPPPPGPPPVRLIVSNVYSFRPSMQEVLDLVTQTDPDIVVLLEMWPENQAEAQRLTAAYPYWLHEPRLTGTAVFSRVPLTRLQPLRFIDGGRIDILLKAEWDGRPFTLIATHTHALVDPEKADWRAIHFQQLGQLIQSEGDDPLIVVGDLNATMWSPRYQDFVATAALVDGRRGRGLMPTWPAPEFFSLPRWSRFVMAVPFDHLLATADVAITHYELGPAVGSDHYPLIIEFVPPAPGGDNASP